MTIKEQIKGIVESVANSLPIGRCATDTKDALFIMETIIKAGNGDHQKDCFVFSETKSH